jgi:hypothetical protein
MKFKIEVYVEVDLEKQDDCDSYQKPSKDEVFEAMRQAIDDGLEGIDDDDVGEGYKLTNLTFDVIEK